MNLTETSVRPEDWAVHIKGAGLEAGFEQSEQWGTLLERLEGAKAHYLSVRDEDKLIATLLVFHRFPWDREGNVAKRGIRQIVSGSIMGWLQWGGGPVFCSADQKERQAALDLLLDWMNLFAKHKDIYKIEGAFPRSCPIEQSQPYLSNFEQKGFRGYVWGTYLIQLEQEEEILWKKLKASARKSVRRARREGVRVERVGDVEQLEERFYHPYRTFEEQAGRNAFPWSSLKTTWETDSLQRYRFYCAMDGNDEVMGVLGVHLFNQVATEITSAINPKAFEAKIPAQDLLHWEIMLEAKASECALFDLAGVDPSPHEPKAIGIRRFKEKWGGEYIEYQRYIKHFRPGLVPRLRALFT